MKTITTFIFCFLLTTISFSQNTSMLPFRNQALSNNERVADLVSRLTLEEKVLQLIEQAPAIDRLGIPAYNWWNEALHGVARSGDTVAVFPQAIGMAATFNPDLLLQIGRTCGEQARAIYNKTVRNGNPGGRYKGLTFWSPNINIFRDPRWGRGQETYGEDPYLTGQLGMAFVRGMQGNDSKYLLTSACAKHFAVHSGPEYSRSVFNATINNGDLWNTYLPAFNDLIVKAKVSGVMCAYNRLNNEPCCGNNLLLKDILRNQWGFEGYVTSDCGAINWMWTAHKTDSSSMAASVNAVRNGTDIECGQFWSKEWEFKSLVDAVKKGELDEKTLDESLKRLYLIRFRLGMFDSPESVPFSKIPYSVLKSKAHHDLALNAARQSMVLLKNTGTLPLSKKIKSIAIVGPNANNKKVLLGNYNGIPPYNITVVDGIKAKLGSDVKIFTDDVSNYVTPIGGKNIESIVQQAAKSDVIIYVGGISSDLEGESGDAGKEILEGFKSGDRTSIALPKIQTAFMQSLKATGKPVIFVNMSGSAMAIPWEHENVDAVLQAWYGGEHAGTAIADILFGDYNPSGRLPITFYKSDSDLPHFDEYSMQNRTYRYFKGEALYPFGHGLSFTKFSYSKPKLNLKQVNQTDTVKVDFKIKNIGKMSGSEVVQLYVSKTGTIVERSIKDLKAIQKVELNPGESKKISFSVAVKDLSVFNQDSQSWEIEAGSYKFQLGSSSTDLKGEASVVFK